MLDLLAIGDSTLDRFLVLDKEVSSKLTEIKPKKDELCFNFEAKIPVKEIVEDCGGNAANVAIGISRLGYKTALFTYLSNDYAGEKILEILKLEGVDLSQVIIDFKNSTNNSIIISLFGERIIFSHHEDRSYVWPRRMPPACWLFLTSMGEGFLNILPAILEYQKKYQSKLVFSPGSHQLRLGIKPFSELLKRTKLIIMNKEEAEIFLGRSASIEELLFSLRNLGPELSVITDGRRGAYFSSSSRSFWIDLIDKRERKEATGAGDSFLSGLLAGLMENLMYEEAMTYGMLNSGSVVQEIGARKGLLTRKEIKSLIKKVEPTIKILEI